MLIFYIHSYINILATLYQGKLIGNIFNYLGWALFSSFFFHRQSSKDSNQYFSINHKMGLVVDLRKQKIILCVLIIMFHYANTELE